MTELSSGVVHDIPDDVRDVLVASKEARSVWEDITPLARNEFLCWITSAKKPETRKKRIDWMLSDFAKGQRRPCCWPGCSHRSKD